MSDNLVSPEEIEEISQLIVENVKELETLEVFLRQDGADDIHFVHNIEKSENIEDFLKYAKETQMLNCEYMNCKFIYNKSSYDDETNSTTYILISSGEIKKGMIIIVDVSGAIFIATCVVDLLRGLNYNLYKVLYPKDY